MFAALAKPDEDVELHWLKVCTLSFTFSAVRDSGRLPRFPPVSFDSSLALQPRVHALLRELPCFRPLYFDVTACLSLDGVACYVGGGQDTESGLVDRNMIDGKQRPACGSLFDTACQGVARSPHTVELDSLY